MMDHEKLIEQLAARARMEHPPNVDVRDRVMAAVRHGAEVVEFPTAALAWVAGLSAAAALPIAIIALSDWDVISDPLLTALIDLPGWLT
jgi:hypothetical protein